LHVVDFATTILCQFCLVVLKQGLNWRVPRFDLFSKPCVKITIEFGDQCIHNGILWRRRWWEGGVREANVEKVPCRIRKRKSEIVRLLRIATKETAFSSLLISCNHGNRARFNDHAKGDLFFGIAECGRLSEQVDVADEAIQCISFLDWSLRFDIKFPVLQRSKDIVQFVRVAYLTGAHIVAIVRISV
jgi:hypothetical protein